MAKDFGMWIVCNRLSIRRSSLAVLRGVLVATAAFTLATVSAQEKIVAKSTKAQRDKLQELDAETRAAFDKANPKTLPEAKYKLPDATAAQFDWVKVLGLTPIHQQGGKPNCVAQATVAALEWNWQMRNGTKTKPILSPQPILDRLQQAGALSYGQALDQLLFHGTTLYASYSYTGEPAPLKPGVTTPYRLVSWGHAAQGGKTPVADIKKALLEHGPLVAGVYTTPTFKAYKGGVFAEHYKNIPEKDPTTHAVVIVGWNDKAGKGCWHIQNSWGLKWGETGGMWIEYGCNNIAHFAYWVRAQSSQYHLPENAHKTLGENATPFHRWPAAKDVAAAQ
jgi:hypothetical protein